MIKAEWQNAQKNFHTLHKQARECKVPERISRLFCVAAARSILNKHDKFLHATLDNLEHGLDRLIMFDDDKQILFRLQDLMYDKANEKERQRYKIVRDIFLVAIRPRIVVGNTYSNIVSYVSPQNTQKRRVKRVELLDIYRDMVNPFHTPIFPNLTQKDNLVIKLSQSIYANKQFEIMPMLADALEEIGCVDAEVLSHCRSDKKHYKVCWVVDMILNKR